MMMMMILESRYRRSNMRYHATFCQNQPYGFGDIVIFRFARRGPSAILDFQNL